MELKAYFNSVNGLGVLSTADSSGKVDSAIYAKPYFMNDGKIVFLMRDKLTHVNLQTNPYATYLFKENGDKYVGKRLYLRKFDESDDEALISQVQQQSSHAKLDSCAMTEKMFLVVFDIEKELPLIGS